ncbi:MAG: glycosyltransferase family 2 protein [Chloroflexota bacterium]
MILPIFGCFKQKSLENNQKYGRKKFRAANPVKYHFYNLKAALRYVREFFACPHYTDYLKIPVIINNFNRVTSLRLLIDSLEKRGYKNIIIIDNNSTFPPLLEYYKKCPYRLLRLKDNLGSNALWKISLYEEVKKDFFVYTDSDMVPVDECPGDFMLFFLNTLKTHRLAQKVGFSLKIDDLPDNNLMKQSIIGFEEHFFTDYREDELLCRAPIATTFAMYRPFGQRKHANNHITMYRTDFPYMARHLPWYQDTLKPDDEERYYLEHLGHSTWWTTRGKRAMDEGKK